VTVTWTTTGDKVVTATNVGCASAVGTHSVSLGDSSFLSANFSFSPGSPAAGQVVTFDASSTSGNPNAYSWDFGDGTTGSGQVTTHAYAQNGSYIVRLTVTRPGTGPGCNSAGVCSSDSTKAVIVGNGGPPLPEADFSASVPCINQFGFEQCSGSTGANITLTATATSTTAYTWDFGDGTTGTGQTVTHHWATGSYQVQLTVSNSRGTSTKTKTFVISVGGGGCIASATRLCLGGNRFAVDVTWRTPAGQTGSGQAVALTSDTGYFWFFSDANVEMILKVLNACTLNQRFWVFAGGLTNVKVDITVTDTATGTSKVYHNPQNTPFQPIQDTSAFATCSAGATSAIADEANLEPRVGTPSGTALLLAGSRFKVETTWRTPAGQTGAGQAVQLTPDTGYFWFFNSANVELVTKVLDACNPFQRYWFFAGGLTDVSVRIDVVDTLTAAQRQYVNPQGTPFAPIQDSAAFATCP
jgi:PKD repeat protein